MALVESLAHQGLDDRLPADVEILGGALELFEHGGGKVHVHALDGFPHFAGIGEEARNILAVVRDASNGFGRDRLLLTVRVLHKVLALRWLPSTKSPGGRIRLPHLPGSQKSPSTSGSRPSRWRDAE